MHKEKSPTQPDWWYFRTASVLRKIGVNGPIGTERLSRHYSGAHDRGSKPNRSSNGSRKVLRLIMQQLPTRQGKAPREGYIDPGLSGLSAGTKGLRFVRQLV